MASAGHALTSLVKSRGTSVLIAMAQHVSSLNTNMGQIDAPSPQTERQKEY